MLKIKRQKFYKKYEEDLWGFLSVSDRFSDLKLLVFLYFKFLSKDYYRKILKSKRLFFYKSQFFYRLSSSTIQLKHSRYGYKSMNRVFYLKFSNFYGGLKRSKVKKILSLIKQQKALVGESFLYYFESRLDIFLYRMNFFNSFFFIRYFIKNRNVLLNGKFIEQYNYRLHFFDIVSFSFFIQKSFYFNFFHKLKKNLVLQNYPTYVEANYKIMSFIFYRLPDISEVRYPFFINVNNIHNRLK